MKRKSYKHNKKRNVAILYEVLVKELAISFFEKDVKRKDIILSIIKEHFNKNTELNKELKLYLEVCDCQWRDEFTMLAVLKEAEQRYQFIDKKEVYKEKSKVISKINKKLSPKIFSHHVPNYKYLASIDKIFNGNMQISKKILLESELVKQLSERKKKTASTNENIDQFTVSSFVKKFNEKYENKLLNEQKELISRYIKSDIDPEFKLYLNEEIYRLKNEFESIKKEDDRIPKILQLVENFKEKEIDLELLNKVLNLQKLINELKAEKRNENKTNSR